MSDGCQKEEKNLETIAATFLSNRAMDPSQFEIDDSLYSRQRYMLGDQAMKRMASSSVLLIGCDSLGIEIAKNLVLTGVKSLKIADNCIASMHDVENNFFITASDVENKLTRASACMVPLSELNPYVSVSTSNADIHLTSAVCGNKEAYNELVRLITDVECIVTTQCTLRSQNLMNEICRLSETMVKFISCNVYGVFSSLFCDFGDEFEVVDDKGEELKEFFVQNITKDNPGVVTCLENRMHGLEDGDCVKFKEVGGMTELNDQTRTVKVVSPYAFSIGDTKTLSTYVTGGIVKQIKIPQTVSHESLKVQLSKPDLMLADLGKLENPLIMHHGFQALYRFIDVEKKFPSVWNDQDADKLWGLTVALIEESKFEISEIASAKHLIHLLSFTCTGMLPSLAATIGGVAAQEALKSLTGKYTPLKQWMYLDASELIAEMPFKAAPSDKCTGLQTCLGPDVVNYLSKLNVFMVGCGAIGCEMLKNLALLGVSTNSDKGEIVITDNDIIEKSNLNRQFLFRSHHIRQPKSTVAATATKDINRNVKIKSLQYKVGPDTEAHIFNDSFYKEQDIVVNALDNVQARRYVDSRCVSNQRPLVESGTMGPKGHVQVVVPFLTESYSSQHDPIEVQVPYCTLKSFPSQIEHTIQWARDKFESLFTKKPSLFNKFWSENSKANHQSAVRSIADRLAAGENIKNARISLKMLLNYPKNWLECVSRARCMFEKYFNHMACQLLHAFPMDTKLQDGSPFWSSPKRPPRPVIFDMNDPLHMNFIQSCASLLAFTHQINIPEDNHVLKSSIEAGLQATSIPDFIPGGKQIVTDENALKPEKSPAGYTDDEHELNVKIVEMLNDANKPLCLTMSVEDFEKDDDSNHHIDFITASSNLRAIMYDIQTVDRLQTKRIAGRIIPAISTTTAAVAGFATIQFLQVVIQMSRRNTMEIDTNESVVASQLSKYRNCFLNLALPLVVITEPAPAPRIHISNNLFYTLWDHWEVHGNQDFKLKDFIEHFTSKFQLSISMVMQGARMVYVPIMPGHSKRLNHPMMKLIKTGEVKPMYMDLTVGFENTISQDDEDLSCPPIRYYFGMK